MTIKTPYKSEVIEEIKIDTSVIDGKVDIVDTSLDTLLSRLTASRANYLDNINNSNLATLPAISSARIGYLDNINNSELLNITSTILGRIDASISSRSSHTADNVWSVATRALTDKANFSLSTTGIDAIRKSVCLTGDTANSIGKILYDYYNTRLSSTRCGYLDLLVNGTYGLAALDTDLDTLISNLGTVDTVVDAIKAKTDLLFSGIATEAKQNTIIGYIDTEVGAIKAKTDLIGASVALSGEYTSALGVIDGYFDVPTANATTDATIRDVVGRKTDTANTTVGTTSSLMRYTKGILGLLTNGTYGLSALETLVDDLEGRLTATRAGYLDYLASGTYGLAAIKTQTGEIYSFLSGYLNQAIKTSSSPSFVKLTLSQATGTAPLTISSTTKCTNLNADMLDGYHSSSFFNTVYYSLGDGVCLSNDTQRSVTDSSYTKLKEITLQSELQTTIRTYFELKCNSSGNTVYGRIYKDGVAVGTLHYTTVYNNYIAYTEDLDFSGGTLYQVYCRGSGVIRNQRILGIISVIPAQITEGY